MALSARNQLAGTVESIVEGQVMAEVTVQLKGGDRVVSAITTNSVHRLKLAKGTPVTVVIKATEVMLATDD